MSNTCFRCKYTWSARTVEPRRCPRCKSTRWNKEVINDKCRRCGAEWVQRGGEVPKYCPMCHSSMWNCDKITYTCPKCGKTRALRSNSRVNLCPTCDLYTDTRTKTRIDETRPTTSGINPVIHLWGDGNGLTLTYIDNTYHTASLYDEGKLVGEINIETWCRKRGTVFDKSVKLNDPEYQDIFKSAAAHIMESKDLHEHNLSAISTLRGVDIECAEIIQLHEEGMTPTSIALKLGISFAKVMDFLNDIPPVVRGDELKWDKKDEKTQGLKANIEKESEKV